MADGASFTELSVDRLATEAGISRASFYVYFEDKGQLLRRLATQVFGEMSEYDAQVGATCRDILAAIAARLTVVIEAGCDDGSIRRELSAETTASTFTWMVERTCQQNLPGRPPSFDAKLAATLTQIIWGTWYLEGP